MATDTEFTVIAGWSAGARITASGATAVLMRNPTRVPVYFVITASDTTPTNEVWRSHLLPAFVSNAAGDSQIGVQLADTERLWLATVDDTVDITVTTGAA